MAMNIVLVGPTSPRFKGGIVHYTHNLYQELRRTHRVRLISYKRSYPKHFFPGVSTRDTSEKQLKVDGELSLIDWLSPLSWIKTATIISALKPDRVIFQWWTWFWGLPYFVILKIIRQKLPAARIICVAHNSTDHEQALFKRVISRLVLSLADAIVVHSREAKKSLGMSKTKIVVALHPLYDFFKTIAKPIKKTHSSVPRLLFFGHVRPYKGLDILLKALVSLWQRGRQVKLIVAGEFWEDKNRYLNLIPSTFRNDVLVIDRYLKNEEVGELFTNCEAVIIPYKSGYGSGPAKIALSFDKPLIATNVADNPDVFALGTCGLLVPANDIAALEGAVDRFLKEKKNYQEGINKIKQKLSWQKLAAEIIRV